MNTANNRKTIPLVIRQILDDVLDLTSKDVDTLFTVCDELFFDLSSRASSDNEENLYFECMRELRQNSEVVSHAYSRCIVENFAACVHGNALPYSYKTKTRDKKDLKLVENDQLEIDIAINNLAANTRSSNQDLLTDIILRMDHLLEGVPIDQENCPLDPGNIGSAFSHACLEHLNINTKCLIIILKQYERHVLNKLGQYFTTANQLLLDEGILPVIPESMKHKIKNPDHSPKPQAEATTQTQDPIQAAVNPNLGTTPQFDMGNLAELINVAKQNGGAASYDVGEYTYTNYSANPGPLMPAVELMQELSSAQAQVAEAHASSKPRNFIRQVIDQLLSQNQPELPQSLAEPEDNIINLVSMFFDFILDDANIPMAIKLQISRLQIPVLKSALRDREFFSSRSHPGRVLINTIAAIGIGFDESKPPEKDPTYKAITRITESINNQHVDNDSIFQDSLGELRQVVEKESRKSSIIEMRTDQAETGRSKLKLAKNNARALILKRLSGTSLPSHVHNFLVEKWLEVLVLTFLKHGGDSPEWVSASQAIDDLIWICQPHTSPKAINRLNEFKVSLIQRIQTGLELINEHVDSQTESLTSIEELIYQAEQNNIDHYEFTKSSQESIAEALPEDALADSVKPSAIQQQKEKYAALAFGNIQKADQMPLGTWLNYMDREVGKEVRCKLSKRLPATETFIFVNRFGFKAMEKHRKEFAYDMQRGRAVPLDATPLFERIFEKIGDNLKNANSSA